MWLNIYTATIQIIICVAAFVIYFRTNIIKGMQPQADLENPPAKRLVLFVMDGMALKPFYDGRLNRAPDFHNLLNEGAMGISRIRPPCESRVGHTALFAGIYEDPNALVTLWRESPNEFDHVFNRSLQSYMFSSYYWFFEKLKNQRGQITRTTLIDYPYFKRDGKIINLFREFLRDNVTEELQRKDQIIFFVYLPDLDVVGHKLKNYTKRILDNQREIFNAYQDFERTFPDNKTSYILTTDHGMNDEGKHGDLATEGPIFVWGAGFKKWRNLSIGSQFIEMSNTVVPLFDVEQVQITSLITTLIGVAPPVNNIGILPIQILNTSDEYAARAIYTNAHQILAQFETILQSFEGTIFWNNLPHYKTLNETIIQKFHKNIAEDFQNSKYDHINNLCSEMMNTALAGLEYYQNYYKDPVLGFICLAVIFWCMCIILMFCEENEPASTQTEKIHLGEIVFALTSFFIVFFIYSQNVPWALGLYMLFPCFTFFVLKQNLIGKKRWLSAVLNKEHLLTIILGTIGSTLLAACFICNTYIILPFLLFAVCKFPSLWKQSEQFYLWLTLTLLVIIFPFFQVKNTLLTNDLLLLIGAIASLVRSFLVRAEVNKYMYLITVAALINTAYCLYTLTWYKYCGSVNVVMSWSYFVYSVLVPLVKKYDSKEVQMEFIFFCFSTVYVTLTRSYEALYQILLNSQLILTLSHETSVILDHRSYLRTSELVQAFQYAYTVLIYVCAGFFGTADVMEIPRFSSRDMGGYGTKTNHSIIHILITIRIILPMVWSAAIILALTGQRFNRRHVFTAILFVINLMGLQLLFFVTNNDSWLAMGVSITRVIVVELGVFVLLFVFHIAECYLTRQKVVKSSQEIRELRYLDPTSTV